MCQLRQECLKIVLLSGKESLLIRSLLLIDLLVVRIPHCNSLDLLMQLNDLVALLLVLGLKLLNLHLNIGLTILGLELLSHGKCHRALIQGLIGCDGHLDLITHSQ